MEELHQHKKALGTIKNNRGSKHEKTTQKTARYTTSVDPTYMSWVASVKPVLAHRMIRQNQNQSSVQLSRDTTKLNFKHRLNRRDRNQNTGAVVQRGTNSIRPEHRFNRRQRNSVRRMNGQNSTY